MEEHKVWCWVALRLTQPTDYLILFIKELGLKPSPLAVAEDGFTFLV